MAKQQALNDNFNTNSLSALWNTPGQLGGAVLANTNKRIEIALPASSTATTDGFLASASTYDLSGSYAFVQVLQVANVATAADATFWLKLDTNNWIRWNVESGTLVAQKMIAGVKTTVFTTAYISGTHQWWKIWESGGTIFFDTSPDGITWTNQATTTVSFAITALQTTLEASCFQNETNPGTVIFDNFNTPGVIITGYPKTYTYHVYKNGTFKGLLTNVITDFAYQQEINSAGSPVTIQLAAAADSYGEGTLVDFNNQVKIYVIDDESPNGSLIFTGFIANYMPVFSDNDQEYVELTVLGYGATFSDYIIETGEIVDVNGNSQNGSITSCTGNINKGSTQTSVVQSFVVGAGVTKLSAVEFVIACHTIDDLANSVLLQVYASQTDAQGSTNGTPLVSATLPITSLTAANYKFTFATFGSVTAGNTYWVRLSYVYSDHNTGGIGDPGYSGQMDIYYDSSTVHGSGILETIFFNGASWQSPTVIASAGAYIKTYAGTGNTQSPYLSQDPSAILKSIIDNYNSQGGQITYTAASIDLTGTTVSYTFNTNTVLEGINQVLTLAPAGWYWYVDQANNVLHLHKQSLTAQATLALGKNIKNLSIEKRAQDIVNVVYFVGGPVAGVNLYQKYTLQSSINLYGRHALRYSDNNVTLAATAQIIANSILTNQAQVELRIEMDILDNAGNPNSILGYNLEALVMGQTISFRSFGPGSGGTLWDQAFWDVAKWDFDITDLSSVVVQITRIDYKPDVVHLSLSTIPPDITKRVQDIYRNLSQLNTLNNPVAPS